MFSSKESADAVEKFFSEEFLADDFTRWFDVLSVSQRKFCRISGLSRSALLRMTGGTSNFALTTRTVHTCYSAFADGLRQNSIQVPKSINLLVKIFDKNTINDFFLRLQNFDNFSETKLQREYLAGIDGVTFDLVHSTFISAKTNCNPTITQIRTKIFAGALRYGSKFDAESHAWPNALISLAASGKK